MQAPPCRAHDDGEFEPEPRFEAGQQVRWALGLPLEIRPDGSLVL